MFSNRYAVANLTAALTAPIVDSANAGMTLWGSSIYKSSIRIVQSTSFRARYIAFVLACAMAAPVAAQVTITPGDLAAPVLFARVAAGGGVSTDPAPIDTISNSFGTITGTHTSANSGSTTATATVNTNQSVFANLSLSGGTDPVYGNGGEAIAYADYVMYIGAATDTTVSVHVTAQGGASISNDVPQSADTRLKSELLIEGVDGLNFGYGADRGKGYFAPDIAGFSWTADDDLTLHTNTRYDVLLQTWVESQTVGGGTINASAYVDPYFFVDSPNASLFNLVFSQGITNAPADIPPAEAVPEPPAWATMIVGFCAVGASLRRRKPALRIA